MDALTLLPTPLSDNLAEMRLADAPDYLTAVAAGIAHNLAPSEALKSAFGKWSIDHTEAIQAFGLANFYDGPSAPRAMVNYSRLAQYLTIMVAEQGRALVDLKEQCATLQQRLTAAEQQLIEPGSRGDVSHDV